MLVLVGVKMPNDLDMSDKVFIPSMSADSA